MGKRAILWLVIAALLVVAGAGVFAAAMGASGWDFTKLSTETYETNTYEITEGFNGIAVDTDTAGITFALSGDGVCRVECYEEENAKHSVAVEADTLEIKMTSEKSWYDYIGIHNGSPKITVYLPQAEYTALSIQGSTGAVRLPEDFQFQDVDISLSTGAVDFCASASEMIKIKASTGDICVENISAGALDLSVTTGKVTVTGVDCGGDLTVRVSTGKVYFTDIVCKNLTSSGNTGDISLKNVIAAETFSIDRSTGDVHFDGCDAAEIFVETDTGDVTGSLLTEKIFLASTDTGKVDVPKTTTGGRCEITTDTGDIHIKTER